MNDDAAAKAAREAARERLIAGSVDAGFAALAAGAQDDGPMVVLRIWADTIARQSIAHELLAECDRQVEVEGFTAEHDDRYAEGELEKAAAAYAFAASQPEEVRGWLRTDRRAPRDRSGPHEWVLDLIRRLWPWSFDWWKPKDRRRNLVRAGALIVQAIAKHDRAQARQDTGI